MVLRGHWSRTSPAAPRQHRRLPLPGKEPATGRNVVLVYACSYLSRSNSFNGGQYFCGDLSQARTSRPATSQYTASVILVDLRSNFIYGSKHGWWLSRMVYESATRFQDRPRPVRGARSASSRPPVSASTIQPLTHAVGYFAEAVPAVTAPRTRNPPRSGNPPFRHPVGKTLRVRNPAGRL